MRERGLEFKVGLLILVSSAILVGFIFVLGNFSLRSGFTIYVDYDYVGSAAARRAGQGVRHQGRQGRERRVPRRQGTTRRSASASRSGSTAWIEDRARDSDPQRRRVLHQHRRRARRAVPRDRAGQRLGPPADRARHDHPRRACGPRSAAHRPRGRAAVRGARRRVDACCTTTATRSSTCSRTARARSPRSTSCSSTTASSIGELIVDDRRRSRRRRRPRSRKVNAGLGDGRPVASLLADADATLSHRADRR